MRDDQKRYAGLEMQDHAMTLSPDPEIGEIKSMGNHQSHSDLENK